MPPRSTYFLCGYFGVGNFGDDILLYSAICNILERDPDAKFLIRNYGPLDFLDAFKDSVTLTDIEAIHHKIIPAPLKFLHLLQAYWHYTGRASHLVIGGGTLIHDSPYLKSTFLLVCLCLIARMRGRKVIGIGLGTKRIQTEAGKFLVGVLVSCFDRLCLRDEQSFQQCRILRPCARNLVLTSDLAYAVDWEFQAHTNKTIAVSLVDYIFEGQGNSKILPVLANTLTGFLQQGFHLQFLSLQKENPAQDIGGDTKVLEHVLGLIPTAFHDKCRIMLLDPEPESIETGYSGVCLMLGMRFHSLVFAAIRGIPFTGLAHEPKIDAICNEFDMPFIALESLTEGTLTKAIQNGLARSVDQNQVDAYRVKAKENFSFLEHL